jgi:chromosome segregation ATPase
MVCKVMKKAVVGAALGAGALALVFGTSAPSYVKTAFWKARSSVKAQVPIQFEIDRARQEVSDLEPAIHQNLENLTKAEVDAEHLEAEIATTQANLEHEKNAIVALRQHLATGDVRLTGNVTYTAEEVKADLARRMDHYREVKRIQDDKRETLKLRKKAVLAAHEQLNKMKAAKLSLMTKIESIETKLKQIEANQAANEFNFDDSALARAKQTISELDRRLEVMARVSEREGRFTDKGLPLVIEPGRDIVKEVDSEFGTPTRDTATADKNL